MYRLGLLHGFIVAMLLAPTAAAQLNGIALGDRVRIAYRCTGPNGHGHTCKDIGRVQVLGSDTLHLYRETTPREVIIPRAAIDTLWAADGTRGHFWAGAGIGLIAGALLGVAIGSTQEFCMFSCSPATGIGLVIGMPVGFMVGGVTGMFIRSDRWRPVTPGAQPQGRYPRAQAVQLGVSVAF
jgi:hypothetical protein